MATPLDPLSRRVRVLLSSHGITTAEQLAAIHPLILLGIRGFGHKALREVEALVRPGSPYERPKGLWPCRCECAICQGTALPVIDAQLTVD